MTFADRLLLLRGKTDLSQKELGEKLGLTHSSISKYEKGTQQPSITVIYELVKFFDVSADYILGLSDEMNPYSAEKISAKEANLVMRYRRLNRDNKIRIEERVNTILENQQREE